MKEVIFLYHKNCYDGFGAAWAAYKKFGSRADYIGVNHGEPPPAGLKNKNVFLVDFSYPEKITKRLLKITKSLAIIDHHISAAPLMKLIPNHSYALNHSGAVLTWMYFHPEKAVPHLLSHIEDIDLWKFKLPYTKELMASLNINDYDFAVWNRIANDWQNAKRRKKYIEEGKIIIKYQKSVIETLIRYAEKVNIGGIKTLAVNSPILMSEMGETLVKKMPPIGIIWSRKNGRVIVSLRSNGKTNVARLAERFGGGGHKASAGFTWGADKPLPWKKIN